MDHEQIRALIDDFVASPLTLLELEQDGTRLKLEKPSDQPQPQAVQIAPQPMGWPVFDAEHAPAFVQAEPPAPVAPQHDEAPQQASSALIDVTCPLVGVFYAAASPQDDPYVAVGSHVQEGDILCLIEAMKMINEVKAPVSGTVKWIVPQNAQSVGFGDLLMQIEPDRA